MFEPHSTKKGRNVSESKKRDVTIELEKDKELFKPNRCQDSSWCEGMRRFFLSLLFHRLRTFWSHSFEYSLLNWSKILIDITKFLNAWELKIMEDIKKHKFNQVKSHYCLHHEWIKNSFKNFASNSSHSESLLSLYWMNAWWSEHPFHQTLCSEWISRDCS